MLPFYLVDFRFCGELWSIESCEKPRFNMGPLASLEEG